MTEEEFTKKFCRYCVNRKNEKDLCNVMRNINWDLRCVNFIKEGSLTAIELNLINFVKATNNLFKAEVEKNNEEEAEDSIRLILENLDTFYQLAKIAAELNNGEKIDWNNYEQDKYSIFYSHDIHSIDYSVSNASQEMGQIYCVKKTFYDEAIKRIGKPKLIDLFKACEKFSNFNN